MQGLATFTFQVHAPHCHQLRYAGAGVVHRRQQGAVTLPAPGAPVRRLQDRLNLRAGQEADHGPIKTLGRDRQDPLYSRQRRRLLQTGIVRKGMDGGEPGIAGAGGIMPTGFQVLEKCQHQLGVQIRQGQLADGFAALGFGKP